MEIQRMINWTTGLWHQFSLMRVIHGNRTCTIIVLQNIGGMVCWRMKIEWNSNETSPSHLKKGNRKIWIFLKFCKPSITSRPDLSLHSNRFHFASGRGFAWRFWLIMNFLWCYDCWLGHHWLQRFSSLWIVWNSPGRWQATWRTLIAIIAT